MKMMLDTIKNFSGTGAPLVILLACVMYLGFSLKKSENKALLVWYPLYVLAIYFCPLWVFYMKAREDGEILYRIFWLIPFAVIICYALVELIFKLPEKVRTISFVFAILFIVLTGKYVYSSEHFSRAENTFHVPDTVVKICDEIVIPGREVMACMPIEFVQYTRQYSPFVCLTFGRGDVINVGVGIYSVVQGYLEEDVLDTVKIVDELKRTNTAFFVVNEERIFTSDIEKNGFIKINSIDGYDIYMDENFSRKLE